jgi:hypothetical protein
MHPWALFLAFGDLLSRPLVVPLGADSASLSGYNKIHGIMNPRLYFGCFYVLYIVRTHNV